MKPKHVGLSSNRLHSGNPREVVFAKLWQEQNDLGETLEYLLSPRNRREGLATDRDREVAATVIQWLGSNVGMSFIVSAIKCSPEIRDFLRINESDDSPQERPK